MEESIFKKKSFLAVIIILGIALILIIWQPVLPSSFIIEKMAETIDVKNLALTEEVVVRFELSGRGGGNYNIVVNNEKAEVIEGDVNRIDLILSMEASSNAVFCASLSRRACSTCFRRVILCSDPIIFSGSPCLFLASFAFREQ